MVSKIEKALDKARILSDLGARRRGLSSEDGVSDNADRSGWNSHTGGDLAYGKTLLDQRVLAERKIIFHGMPDNRMLNIFRDLATRLLQREQRTSFSVMITSVVPGGGGSFVALNCAAALGLSTQKTLLVDCNLRTPGEFQGLAPAAEFGLFDYLIGMDVTPDDLVQGTGVYGLQIIPAIGRKSTSPRQGGGISSDRMGVLLSEFKQRKRELYVVLDAPPATTQLADIRVLSQLCDYLVLVVPYGRANETQIQNVQDAIAKEKLVGVIFNEGRIRS